jgi:hypothetical protein
MMMTTNGRQPQNIKSGMYQQPPIGSYSNLNLILDDQTLQILKMKTSSDGRQPQNITGGISKQSPI